MRLNILVIHDLANFSRAMPSMADYTLCFERYAPQHNYLYHRISDPVTNVLRQLRFHVVIVDSVALSIRRNRPRERWYAIKERLRFLGESDAVKIGFPQDDYHDSMMVDELFHDWNFDIIYTVLPEHHALIYPRSIGRAHIETVLTGYVDDRSIRTWERFAKPFSVRSVDLGTRVTLYSPFGGRHAQRKGLLAEDLKNTARAAGFKVDISTRVEDRIYGEAWPRFLGNCRFVAGSEGGVSVWDPTGEIWDRCDAFSAEHPNASLEETERACFPGVDGKYVFSAVSPRLFEVAMVRSCQILIEAPYLGVLKPYEHYIPVKPDLSNVDDAIDMMRDAQGAELRIAACYAALVDAPEWRYSSLVSRVLRRAEPILARRRIAAETSELRFNQLKEAHAEQLNELARQQRNIRWRESDWYERISYHLPPQIKNRIPPSTKRAVRGLFTLVRKCAHLAYRLMFRAPRKLASLLLGMRRTGR